MILLIILANSNDHGSLRTSRLIKLFRILTLYLYNSWYNLKPKRDISIFDRQSNASVETILSSKYTLESPVKAHRKITGEGRGFKVTMNHLMAGMVILNPYKKNFKLDRDIYFLLGIDQRLQERNLTGRFTSLNTNLFYCDLLDKDENLFNGEPTSVLGCFEIAESQFEKVDYSPPYPVLRKISPRKDITSIRISSLVRIRRSLISMVCQ